MPELISEGSVKKPLLVGAADPYEFIAEHAADAAYWSDVPREAARIRDDALLAYGTRKAAAYARAFAGAAKGMLAENDRRPMNVPTRLLAEAPVNWRRARDQEETAPGAITSEKTRPLPLTASIGRSAPYPVDGLPDVLGMRPWRSQPKCNAPTRVKPTQ
jgi:hypothetical protein